MLLAPDAKTEWENALRALIWNPHMVSKNELERRKMQKALDAWSNPEFITFGVRQHNKSEGNISRI